MPEIILVHNEFITVRYLDNPGIIYHTVHRPIPDEPLKEALNAGSDALEKYRVCKWLSDDRLNGPVSQEIAEWGQVDWNPRTIAAGWKYWANVVPQAVADAGTLAPVIQNLFNLGLRMMVFTTLEDAFQWLDRFEC